MNSVIVTEQILGFYSTYAGVIWNIATTLLILSGIWGLRRVTQQFILDRVEDFSQSYSWRRTINLLLLLVGFFAIAAVWMSESALRFLSTYFGLLSAGIAIALQDPITNFIAWIYITISRPFKVGDRIQIAEDAGDVIDQSFFHFNVLEIRNWVEADHSTGRILRVPNRLVFSQTLANYSAGVPYIWHEIPVEVTFESDWVAAKTLMEELSKKYSIQASEEELEELRTKARKANIRMPNMAPIVFTKVEASGVRLTLRLLCKPRQRRMIEQQIWEDILHTFAERNDMDFAYPTQRVFYHPKEGKTLLLDHSEVAHPKPM